MPVTRELVPADLTHSHRFLTLERVYEKQVRPSVSGHVVLVALKLTLLVLLPHPTL